jgi:hypothetical protein
MAFSSAEAFSAEFRRSLATNNPFFSPKIYCSALSIERDDPTILQFLSYLTRLMRNIHHNYLQTEEVVPDGVAIAKTVLGAVTPEVKFLSSEDIFKKFVPRG